MAVYLYAGRNYTGKKLKVTGDISDLSKKGMNNKASSLKLTSNSDKVLLFEKKDWKGGVMFMDAEESVPVLSSKRHEGKAGFGNTISSVRMTPFWVDISANIICTDEGEFPGGIEESYARKCMRELVRNANEIWKKALVQFRIDGKINIRKSSKYYDLKGEFAWLNLKTKWRVKNQLSVFLVNDIKGTMGISKSPGFGRCAAIDYEPSITTMSNILAHELGHMLGIHHPSGGKDKRNLMTVKDVGYSDFSKRTRMNDYQTEKVHRILAKNIFRKGMRNG